MKRNPRLDYNVVVTALILGVVSFSHGPATALLQRIQPNMAAPYIEVAIPTKKRIAVKLDPETFVNEYIELAKEKEKDR